MSVDCGCPRSVRDRLGTLRAAKAPEGAVDELVACEPAAEAGAEADEAPAAVSRLEKRAERGEACVGAWEARDADAVVGARGWVRGARDARERRGAEAEAVEARGAGRAERRERDALTAPTEVEEGKRLWCSRPAAGAEAGAADVAETEAAAAAGPVSR
jgi:hypothetical protein